MTSALVLGATGSTGAAVLERLLQSDSIEKIWVVARRKIAIPNKKVSLRLIQDFSLIKEEEHDCWKCENVVCCIGSTLKDAGSKEERYRIDHDFVLAMAKNCKLGGLTRHFHLVSSSGANSSSMFSYLKLKGDVERDLIELGFPGLSIYRPTLLRDTKRKEQRFWEDAANLLITPVNWLIPGYATTSTSDLATCILHQILNEGHGCKVLESRDIYGIANGQQK